MSKSPRAEALVSFVAGLLFAVGLAVAGMTQPSKVVSFLDFAGRWDPSLAFVMVGAIVAYRAGLRLARARAAPLLRPSFELPVRRGIEPRLVLGAALFGVGWGLGGVCPGPGLTALGSGSAGALVFVAAMSAGMLLFDVAQRARANPRGDSAALTGEEVDMARFASASEHDAPSARQLVEGGAILVDVRSFGEFLAGHIEGALNVPLPELRERVDELGTRARPIVVYCRSGARSAQAALLLREQGFQRVHDLGSMLDWGRP
jgi:rhodanese-related sulfurtransferase/uncharacterized membrane protein YedE/YeeE